jgi:uncharacterized protein (UPF0332 family)
MRTSLEDLLRSGVIHKIKPDQNLARNALVRSERDIDTAKTLFKNRKYDWSLAVSYNAMLQAGRALMLKQGYRPSSKEGHVSVVRFLHEVFGMKIGEKLMMTFDSMRKKRHRIVYEEMDIVSEAEAEQHIEWATMFVNRIAKLVEANPN